MGIPEGKRPLVRPRLRLRWEGYSDMDIQEMGWGCTEWITVAQDRDSWRALVNAAINHVVP